MKEASDIYTFLLGKRFLVSIDNEIRFDQKLEQLGMWPCITVVVDNQLQDARQIIGRITSLLQEIPNQTWRFFLLVCLASISFIPLFAILYRVIMKNRRSL